MLTKSEYQALQGYQNPVYVSGENEYRDHFRSLGYIVPADMQSQSDGFIGIHRAESYVISLAGKLALEEYETAEAERAHQKRVDRATIWTAILTGIGIIVSVVSIITAFLR